MKDSKRPRRKAAARPRLAVIGASAGGVQALIEIASGLTPRLQMALLVAIHTSPTGSSVLPRVLNRAGPLRASYAVGGEPIHKGRIYIAPPDHHLLVKRGRLHLSRGPRENGFRPAVDPLMRTAARVYGPSAVGIILSGGLDDGTSGLLEIKKHGGIAIVQDPAEALYPSMPQSALQNVDVDYTVSLAQLPDLIVSLANGRPTDGATIMRSRGGADARDIAEIGTNRLEDPDFSKPPSAFTCPECGGALWGVEDGKLQRFRCHLGHGYTADGLNDGQTRNVENALWTAMRALEESALLRRQLAMRSRQSDMKAIAASYDRNAQQAEKRAAIIRAVLIRDEVGKTVTAIRPGPKVRERSGRVTKGLPRATRGNNGNGHGGNESRRHSRKAIRAT